MKKIITIILCVFFISCAPYEGTRIKKVEYIGSSWIKFTTENNRCFYSKKLIYQVGDTLKFKNE